MENHILLTLINSDSNSGSLENRQAIQDWKKKSPDNEELFHFFNDLELYQDELKDYKDYNLPDPARLVSTRGVSTRLIILLMLSLCVIFFFWFFSRNTQDGTINFAVLPDQSEIQLYGSSDLELEQGFGISNRNLVLRGKAFFEVRHNPELPFVISTHTGDVVVKGTSFMVEEVQDGVRLVVREGTVEYKTDFYSKTLYDGEGALFLSTGIETYYTTDFSLILINETYNEASLSDIVDLLVDKYQIRVELSSSLNVDSCVFNGSFKNASVFDILDEWVILFQLKYQVREGAIYIVSADCF